MINYFQNYLGLSINLNYMRKKHPGIKESQRTRANTQALDQGYCPECLFFMLSDWGTLYLT